MTGLFVDQCNGPCDFYNTPHVFTRKISIIYSCTRNSGDETMLFSYTHS